MADYDQQGDSVPNDCFKLVGFVTDAAIVGDGYPARRPITSSQIGSGQSWGK
jgi:hypothetical protein